MTVIDVRGTHGSGKSWVVHQLLKLEHTEIQDEQGNHLGYHVAKYDAAVVGKYSTTCGGCDGVGSADEVVRRVRLFAKSYRHVVLEGILVAHTFQRYSDLADELKAYGYRFMFLGTPLQNCIARVRARRLKAGNQKEFDPRNVKKDWHNIWNTVRGKCLAHGHDVAVLQWRNPLPQVLKELE